MVSVVSINLGIGFYRVETGDTGETFESEERLQVRGFPIVERKHAGDVLKSVRTLPCHSNPVISLVISITYGISAKIALSPSRFHFSSFFLNLSIPLAAGEGAHQRHLEPTYLLGNQGRNTLVLLLYSAKSGFSAIFFSSIGIPETFKIKMVIVRGPMIPNQPPPCNGWSGSRSAGGNCNRTPAGAPVSGAARLRSSRWNRCG